MFTPEQKGLLQAPLDRSKVKTNPRGYDYVEGWHAIAEANRIFGFDAWTRELVRLDETNRDLVTLTGKSGPYQQWRVGYLAVVEVTVGAVVRQGTGFGSGMGKPEALGDAIESAIKEAETDAMKRALMTFGNPFGLALYDKEQRNVAVVPEEDSPIFARLLEGLGTCQTAKHASEWARANAQIINSLNEGEWDRLQAAMNASEAYQALLKARAEAKSREAA
jgi:DNA repair and recombination protein RAD52